MSNLINMHNIVANFCC